MMGAEKMEITFALILFHGKRPTTNPTTSV